MFRRQPLANVIVLAFTPDMHFHSAVQEPSRRGTSPAASSRFLVDDRKRRACVRATSALLYDNRKAAFHQHLPLSCVKTTLPEYRAGLSLLHGERLGGEELGWTMGTSFLQRYSYFRLAIINSNADAHSAFHSVFSTMTPRRSGTRWIGRASIPTPAERGLPPG